MKNVKTVSKGRKRLSPEQFAKVDKLVSGKKCIIKKKDWKLVEHLGSYMLRRYLKKEFKVQSLADGSGWIVTRK